MVISVNVLFGRATLLLVSVSHVCYQAYLYDSLDKALVTIWCQFN